VTTVVRPSLPPDRKFKLDDWLEVRVVEVVAAFDELTEARYRQLLKFRTEQELCRRAQRRRWRARLEGVERVKHLIESNMIKDLQDVRAVVSMRNGSHGAAQPSTSELTGSRPYPPTWSRRGRHRRGRLAGRDERGPELGALVRSWEEQARVECISRPRWVSGE